MKEKTRYMVGGLFIAVFALACGGTQKSRGAELVEEDKDPDLVAELTGIDKNTHVEVDEADKQKGEERPSGGGSEGGLGQDEDAIGGSKGAFVATMIVNGKEAKGSYTIKAADNEGAVVRENVGTGQEVSLDPGNYDMIFKTNNIVGEPDFPLRDIKIEGGRRIKREVKIPTGQITLVTGGNCARKSIKIRLKGATDWYKGKFTTCQPITLMAGEYDAQMGEGNKGVPISGIQVYDGGIRDILIRPGGGKAE